MSVQGTEAVSSWVRIILIIYIFVGDFNRPLDLFLGRTIIITLTLLASTLMTGCTKHFNNTNGTSLCDGRELQYTVDTKLLAKC